MVSLGSNPGNQVSDIIIKAPCFFEHLFLHISVNDTLKI